MATITQRNSKRGTRHTAQIRINRAGERYTESKTFNTRREAERWAVRREMELENPGAITRAKAEGLTVGDLIRQYMTDFEVEYRYGRSKLADLKRLLMCEIAKLPAISLRAMDFVEHIKERRKECGPATATNDLVWLRVVLKRSRTMAGVDVDLQQIDDATDHCRAAGLISRPVKRDRRPSLDELGALIEFFESGQRYTMPMVDIVLFALFSARRLDEITRLRWADLDGTRILVRDMKDPRSKRGNDVWVNLTPEALAIVKRQPKAGTLIFPYNSRTIGANFTRAHKMLGIEGLVFHSLRHECTSWLFELGWQIPQVAMVTGHRSWQTLQRYTHLSEGGQFDKYEGWKWRPSI